jgi:hypothetical protein
MKEKHYPLLPYPFRGMPAKGATETAQQTGISIAVPNCDKCGKCTSIPEDPLSEGVANKK